MQSKDEMLNSIKSGAMPPALNDDKKLSQQFIAASPIGITIYGPDGQCIMANDAGANILGATQDLLLAQNFLTLRSWQESGLAVLAKEVLDGDTPRRKSFSMTTSFGKEIWIDCQYTKIMHRGEPHLMAMFSDVSDFQKTIASLIEARRSAEKVKIALLYKERFIRVIADNMPGLIGYFDNQLICQFANKPLAEWFGAEQTNIVGSSISELFGRRIFKEIEKYIRAALSGQKQGFEAKFQKTFVSTDIPVWAEFIPDIQEDGEVAGFFVSVSDLSDLMNSESRMIAENSHDAFLVTGASFSKDVGGHKILYTNAALENQSGYSREELIGRTPRFLNAPDGNIVELERIKKAVRANQAVRARVKNRRKNGEEYWVDASIMPIKNASGVHTHWISIQHDASERVIYEKQILDSIPAIDAWADNSGVRGLTRFWSAGVEQKQPSGLFFQDASPFQP